GHSLGRHGYRKIPGRAPMLEALASATIYASKWDKNSAFVNPMCGSGTLAIEAALMAKRVPPSMYRDRYAFMSIKGYDHYYYDSIKQEIKSQIRDNVPFKIIASDLSRKAIDNARKNAEAA